MNCSTFQMDKNKNCSACNVNLEKHIYKRERTICKSYYNKKKRKSNAKTNLLQNKLSKIDNVSKSKNRTLNIGFSNCGKIYLLKYILFQKQKPIHIITKSLNQYLNIKAPTWDEIQPLENYENSVVVFDDTLLSKQESNIDLFFTTSRHKNIDFYFISQNFFSSAKVYYS